MKQQQRIFCTYVGFIHLYNYNNFFNINAFKHVLHILTMEVPYTNKQNV